jgi:hypothetical protein
MDAQSATDRRIHMSKLPPHSLDPAIPELIPNGFKICASLSTGSRLNLVIPIVSETLSYGGVPTALRLFKRLSSQFEFARMVVTHEEESNFDFSEWPEWIPDQANIEPRTVALLGDRKTPLVVFPEDCFLTTFWSTTTYVKRIISCRAEIHAKSARRFVYLIQDYEPGFYPWSDRYSYAMSTYDDGENIIAVFNSQLLSDYFSKVGFQFSEKYTFEPMLHPRLQQARAQISDRCKDRLILVYGRPSSSRNGFTLVIEALRIWATIFPSSDWSVVSVGEPHADVPISNDLILRSLGKLKLPEYADHLSRCWAGLSLMFSPHPSYPPLEMAEFGAWVVTNGFENKNLSEYSPNIISVEQPTPDTIAEKLAWCCSQYQPGKIAVVPQPSPVFRGAGDEFPFAPELLRALRPG